MCIVMCMCVCQVANGFFCFSLECVTHLICYQTLSCCFFFFHNHVYLLPYNKYERRRRHKRCFWKPYSVLIMICHFLLQNTHTKTYLRMEHKDTISMIRYQKVFRAILRHTIYSYIVCTHKLSRSKKIMEVTYFVVVRMKKKTLSCRLNDEHTANVLNYSQN